MEAMSLTGGGGAGLTAVTSGFQSFLGIPGFSSHRNGTEGGCLICFLLEETCCSVMLDLA
ncbi:unnamed protein product, partial [Vitis vinifera]|uniref:Uncharacterized protein n=1 Tax=Vitis vinifera TaxID=29760 RepID=D7T1X2_VITVI